MHVRHRTDSEATGLMFVASATGFVEDGRAQGCRAVR